MDNYQKFIHKSRYARWLRILSRRETWDETVARYIDFFRERNNKLSEELWGELYDAIYNLEVMPSMRCLMTAGEALDRDNVAGYNCSYNAIQALGKKIELTHDELDEPVVITLSDPVDFDEMMYVLMCGTGFGYSVERQYVNKLPKVGKKLNRRRYLANNVNYPGVDKTEISKLDKSTNTVVVEDSKYGWSSALRVLLFELYNGNFDVDWDVSKVRGAGEPLKTFGGRASGPEPLVDLFTFCKALFIKAEGRKLTSIECHDICCKIADIVVVGGVRRSALISLSNPSDDRLRRAKSGMWWQTEPQRALANNSSCYTEKPEFETFMKEWQALYESRSGERGMFSRTASQNQAWKNGRRDSTWEFGTNPCSEIILRPNQFCNLSEVIVRPDDTLEDLVRKVRLATILGTLQATLTDFKYLRPIWKQNTQEEALLGVSMTGIMDHPILSGRELFDWSEENVSAWRKFVSGYTLDFPHLDEVLQYLKASAVKTNKEWAKILGIRQSAAVTCIKPSGTVSQLTDTASGIHPRFADYYIRRVRADVKDPLAIWMREKGFPCEVDVMKESNLVFSFPVQAPKGSVTVEQTGAMEQLRLWKIYQDNWCEHKPSITVYYTDDEFLKIGDWLWENFDDVSGISFLPVSEHTYQQAPYEKIDVDTYNALKSDIPDVDWSTIVLDESTDNTEGSQTLACAGGNCEL